MMICALNRRRKLLKVFISASRMKIKVAATFGFNVSHTRSVTTCTLSMSLISYHSLLSVTSHAADQEESVQTNSIQVTARNNYIGAANIAAWREFYQNLQKLDNEAHEAGLETRVVREAVSKFTLEGTAIPNIISALPALKELLNPLRAVGNHVGCAFKDKKMIISVPCCYGCKISLGYDEGMTAEELEKNIVEESKEFKTWKRIHNAHSCAEIVASHYCVMERLNGEESQVADTVPPGEPSSRPADT
ncbi:hypothetical protein CEK26_011353 [Fusarium fujikuroi]|nr:hypothetical protein CEK27_011372 [Fusarium fujikuroi]QGI84628.1 hypothetical protein CEK25_011357 [Fusarium fujikuroi]QGI98284.1 hypothetical protein CEK26_011353 [Fusarium fujikuroi]